MLTFPTAPTPGASTSRPTLICTASHRLGQPLHSKDERGVVCHLAHFSAFEGGGPVPIYLRVLTGQKGRTDGPHHVMLRNHFTRNPLRIKVAPQLADGLVENPAGLE